MSLDFDARQLPEIDAVPSPLETQWPIAIIPKANGKIRPLGISSPRDCIVRKPI